MRRLIVNEFVSLDGLAAGAAGEVDFIPQETQSDATIAEHQLRFVDALDTIVLGRTTYEMFAGYWPTADGDEKVFADKLNAIPKVVFSSTLDRAPWGAWEEASISREDPRVEVSRLREQAGKDLVVWGSLSLARTLAEARLVDEYQIWVLPLVLGSGQPLFGDRVGAIGLNLLDTKRSERGAVLLRYEPRT